MTRPPPEPVFTFKGLMKPVHSLCYCLMDSGEFIYAGTQDGKVHVWDLKKNREVRVVEVGENACLAIHRLADGRFFVTQEKCGDNLLWREDVDTGNWNLERRIGSEYIGFCRSVLDPETGTLVYPEKDGSVKMELLDGMLAPATALQVVSGNGEVMSMKYVHKRILVAYESGRLKIWSTDTGACLDTLDITTDCPMSIDFNKELNKGVLGTSSSEIFEFGVENGLTKLSKLRSVTLTNPGVSCISIRPDGKLFVAGCWDGRIRYFSFKTFKLLAVLDYHRETVQDLVFSPSCVLAWSTDFLLASAGLDGRISLWNLYPPK